ncbi:MAG: hypothetical protein STSR0002_09620 [Smithella sp.]
MDRLAEIYIRRKGEYNQQIRSALLAVPKFGHDGSQEAAEWVKKTLHIYCNALKSVENCPRDGIYTAGYYALAVPNFIDRALTKNTLSGYVKSIKKRVESGK